MSAFVCDTDHLKALALFAAQRVHSSPRVDPRYIDGAKPFYDALTDELASYYANVLYAENVRSVAARYPNDDFDNLPGLCEKPYSVVIFGRDEMGPIAKLKPLAILKMLDCWEYQSCETADFKDSLAYRIAQAIRGAAIRVLPGYDDAPWEYSADGVTQ